MVKQDGILSLWRGWGPTVLRDVPFSCKKNGLFWYVQSKNVQILYNEPLLCLTSCLLQVYTGFVTRRSKKKLRKDKLTMTCPSYGPSRVELQLERLPEFSHCPSTSWRLIDRSSWDRCWPLTVIRQLINQLQTHLDLWWSSSEKEASLRSFPVLRRASVKLHRPVPLWSVVMSSSKASSESVISKKIEMKDRFQYHTEQHRMLTETLLNRRISRRSDWT